MNHRERIEELIADGDFEQAEFILAHARYAVGYAGFHPGDGSELLSCKPGMGLPKFHESMNLQRTIEPVRLFWTINRAGELWDAMGHIAIARIPILAEALATCSPSKNVISASILNSDWRAILNPGREGSNEL